MAIINTGFLQDLKFSAFYEVRKIYNFAFSWIKEKIVNLAKCKSEKSVLFNPVLTIAEPLPFIGGNYSERKTQN